MAVRYRFPDRIVAVGWVLALLGLTQAVYFFVVEWTAESLWAGKLGGQLPQAKSILFLHLIIAVALLVAGAGLVAKQNWAWWTSVFLLAASLITSGLELAMGSASALKKATSAPETAVAIAGMVVWVIMLIVLARARPQIAERERGAVQVEQVDEHTLAVIQATRKMSSRRQEDWSAEGDDEDLLESLVWMTQAREGDSLGTGTEEVKAHSEELDRRIESLPTVIDASPLAIAVTDVEGNVTLWNPAAERLFRTTEQEMKGKPIPLGIPAGDVEGSTLLDRAAREGSVIGIESEHRRSDGSAVPISMSISVLPDTERKVGGYVVALTDLTERRDALAQELTRRRTQALEATQMEILAKFAETGELIDSSHSKHAQRVTAITTLVAHRMGYENADAIQIGRAALLHDIGKMGVSSDIWNKTGRLTDHEFEIVKTHTTVGRDILASTQSPLLRMAADIAYSHHERWDGFGYLGLSGEEIPIGARLVAVADAFDALTHDRPYRKARSVEQAATEIRNESGNQFDPQVVGAFLAVLEAGHLEAVNAD